MTQTEAPSERKYEVRIMKDEAEFHNSQFTLLTSLGGGAAGFYWALTQGGEG